MIKDNKVNGPVSMLCSDICLFDVFYWLQTPSEEVKKRCDSTSVSETTTLQRNINNVYIKPSIQQFSTLYLSRQAKLSCPDIPLL